MERWCHHPQPSDTTLIKIPPRYLTQMKTHTKTPNIRKSNQRFQPSGRPHLSWRLRSTWKTLAKTQLSRRLHHELQPQDFCHKKSQDSCHDKLFGPRTMVTPAHKKITQQPRLRTTRPPSLPTLRNDPLEVSCQRKPLNSGTMVTPVNRKRTQQTRLTTTRSTHIPTPRNDPKTLPKSDTDMGTTEDSNRKI